MATTKKSASKEAKEFKTELSVEERLRALYDLQLVDSRIDRIRSVRGELPLEVRDLEDEISGLEARKNNVEEEIKSIQTEISKSKQRVKESQALIKKYEAQQHNVRNNREFESLAKEIEFQQLEIQLEEKRSREAALQLEEKKAVLAEVEERVNERKQALEHKLGELDEIIAETEKEEALFVAKSEELAKLVDERLLRNYHRIRGSMANGLCVVAIERDACGGCFNKIPPQRRLDIAQRKKIIYCEHCGRILVDEFLAIEEQDKLEKQMKLPLA
ncbi:MAG: C4-type zinc ribbon domain-containing protein [Flavobacteriales bacterium]|nr:C4-type zinc ribbon domain-containing protein [Flavobacteriales bacterium]MCX7649986.1 C4-type zinc ribbon domain-containing protein [Flavobacteriales bacterium]MDW8433144.1 C4-type zinc ribbon domain-containing protein [Flavobacteriales bacterium]